ncbi:MAG: hypothetical protein DHS20C15_30310 [Planctomycetota bacterium]|nr:MAG: hypothetical protein DHS20C15_30310 [Planctomycetota bacterium]
MRCILALVVLLVGTSCSAVPKELALKTNERLSTLATERDAAWAEALKEVSAEATRSLRARLNGMIDLAEARAIAHLYELTEERVQQLVNSQLTQLEGKLRPIVSDLEDKLEKATQQASVTGDRTEEIAHALQLSTVLSAYGHESLRISGDIRDRLTETRERSLVALGKALDEVRTTQLPDSDAITTELATRVDAESKRFLASVGPGYEEVRRYISDHDKAGSFLAKGLLGESLGSSVSDYLSSKAAALTARVDTAILSKLESTSRKFMRDLDRASAAVTDDA